MRGTNWVNRPLQQTCLLGAEMGRVERMQMISHLPWMARTGDQIDRIRINALTRETVAGVPVWVKRRTWLSRLLVPVANGFFCLAGNPVEVLATNEDWRRHEMDSFHLLNGTQWQVGALQKNVVYSEILPGADLVHLLDLGQLTSKVIRQVGSAFRKMHLTIHPANGASFSHGDPHLGNVVYDSTRQTVNWVDFETTHHSHLSDNQRQADDLLVFLLDLVGRVNDERWQSLSCSFLEGYDAPEVLPELRKRLRLPSGFGAIWWAVRTSYLPREEQRRKMGWLREKL